MTNKTIQRISKIFILSLMPLFIALPAQSGVIVGSVNTDTQTELNISWLGTGVINNAVFDNSLTVDGLVNWSVSSPIALTYLGGGDGWSGMLSAFHTARPHNEQANGGTVSFSINFGNSTLPNVNSSKFLSVGHAPHGDYYNFSYSYLDTENTFSATLVGIHVPEPSTLAIFALGMIGLASRRFKKNS